MIHKVLFPDLGIIDLASPAYMKAKGFWKFLPSCSLKDKDWEQQFFGPTASTSPGSLSPLGVGPSICVLTNPPGGSAADSNLRITGEVTGSKLGRSLFEPPFHHLLVQATLTSGITSMSVPSLKKKKMGIVRHTSQGDCEDEIMHFQCLVHGTQICPVDRSHYDLTIFFSFLKSLTNIT